jgi:hypothetical protein
VGTTTRAALWTSALLALAVTCWSEHAWNPSSDHPEGRACDFFPGGYGDFAEDDDPEDATGGHFDHVHVSVRDGSRW